MTGPRRRPHQRPEQVIQRHCAGILKAYVPPPPEGPFHTAINPVPSKSKAVAGISKAMGMRAGVPDLLIVHEGRTIFVEFKAGKAGRVSPEQRARQVEIEAAGGIFRVARSVDDFLAVLEEFGVPCRVSRSGRTIGNTSPMDRGS